jgi:hypothetical protein
MSEPNGNGKRSEIWMAVFAMLITVTVELVIATWVTAGRFSTVEREATAIAGRVQNIEARGSPTAQDDHITVELLKERIGQISKASERTEQAVTNSQTLMLSTQAMVLEHINETKKEKL